LIQEITRRFAENKNALHDLLVVTRKLENMNEKLRQAEALKSDFLSNIRHEINNPLTVVLGMSRQLCSKTLDLQTSAMIGEMIHQEAFELDFQLKNIFMAAEIEAGECLLGISSTDIKNLICNIMDSFKNKAAAKKVTVTIECAYEKPEEQLFFTTDPEKFSCILANLLSNAIEYSREEGHVHITVRKKNNELVLTVRDEGSGISEEDRNKIFDRFTQLETGGKKHHKGHGLGLSITRALVEMLDGNIRIESMPGHGCTFIVSIRALSDPEMTEDISEDSNEYIFKGTQQF